MKSSNFLNKLEKEKKIELIEHSEAISESYEKKSKDCLLSAKLLFESNLFENAIGEAYYAIYNIVRSLFFRCGIKCENHSVAAIIIKQVFQLEKIYKIFSEAKLERIDKQYYVITSQTNPVTKDSAQDLINISEEFMLEVINYKRNLKLEDISKIRKRFKEFLNQVKG